MRVLVDTCGWIEFLSNGPLSDSYAKYLTQPSFLIVPTLVQYELYKWVKRNHGENKADEAVVLTKQGIVLELTSSIALQAADLSIEFGLAMADAIVYATAKTHKVPLATSDAIFKDLPGVNYIKKP